MALPLADVLHLGEAVTAISWDPSASDGVGVTTRDRRVDADHVVVTCSFVAVRDVDFEPELPAVLRRAVDELDYGTVTKTAIQYAERRWARGYATTETLAQRVYEPTADQPGTAGVLMAYGGGDGGRTLGELDEAARIERIAGELGAMYGDLGRRLGGFSRAWANERRFGGSYSNYGPGQVTAFWDEIRAPHGNLWIAGEHAATWCGYLEGAVESGERVAAEIDQR
jgi:monoamine oxidase